MLATLLPWILVVVSFAGGLMTSWSRHWPSNRETGTQHILIAGMMVQAALFGVALSLFVG